MFKRQLFKWSRFIHKWAGLVLGVQLLLWLAGGVIMSVFPRDKVHGNHLVNHIQRVTFAQSAYQYPINRVIGVIDSQIKSINFTSLLNQPMYRIRTNEAEHWFNAVDGTLVGRLSEGEISQLAQSYYVGEGVMGSVTLLDQMPMEMRGRNAPLWQVQFDDWVNTTLYLSPHNGQMVKVRSDIWRVYDFFWMLHIMDYAERDDSHNWLLIIFSSFGFLFAISGVILFFAVFKKRDFTFKWIKLKRTKS